MVRNSSKMERDFLGLNKIKYSSQHVSESASSSKFLSSKAPTREDDICYPFPFGSNTTRLSLAKNAWTLPTTNTTPNSSTNVSNPISRNNHLQLEQLEPLSMLYSGKVHVFKNISKEKVELIMRIASSTTACETSEPRTLELIPKENHGPNMQPPAKQSPSPCIARGGLAMARRATLARFLEKRMHRLSNARPYDLNLKSSTSNSEQASNETNVSHWQ